MAIMAAIWPLGVYTFVPGPNLHATTIVTLLAFALVVADALRQRRLRIPFELIVPWLATGAVALYLTLTTSSATPRQLILALMIVAVPIHFRPSDNQIRRWVELSELGGVTAAAITAVGWIAGWMPTAYSLTTGANLHFAWSMAGGINSLLFFLVLAAALVMVPRTRTALRILWALGAVLIAAVAATAIASHVPAMFSPGPPLVHWNDPATIILAVLLLYGAARIIAKVMVDAEERMGSPKLASPSGALHVVFLLILITMAGGAALTGDVPMVGYGFMAGLAAAYALRTQQQEPGVHLQSFGFVAAAALLLVNVPIVFPEHRLDGRNYSAAAAVDFAAGALDQLHRRLDFVERHAPDERRTHWWRARVLLGQARPMRAVTEFEASLVPAQRQLLPAPGRAERDIFLLQLRDVESAASRSRGTYGYARALVAVGNTDEALSFVRMRANRDVLPIPELNPKPLADAVAFLLDNNELAADLRTWESGELLAVLHHWGADVIAAPEWFNPVMLPVVLAGSFELDTTQTLVTMPGDRDLQEEPFTVEPQPTTNMETSWTPLYGDARKWVVEWTAPTLGRGPARITGREETWDLLTYATTLTAIPEHAAVTVWVPNDIAQAIADNAAG